MKSLLAVFICLVSLTSCTNDTEPEIVYVVPSNLDVSIYNPNDSSGYVRVTATADNAFHYDFYFGEKFGEEAVRSSDGEASHTYADPGTYEIEVRALGNGSEYINYTETIEIVKASGGTTNGWIPSSGSSSPTSYSGMNLVWQDEFDGDQLNTDYWNYEIGTGGNGWGNNELQYYRRENTSVTDGYLFIEAKKESFGGRSYTSSRLTTENKFDFQYGRVDIRAALPKGQGIWPALWMLGKNFRSVGWPACGEIDIMEMIGGGDGRDNVTHGTIHWEQDGHASYTGDYKLSKGILYDNFHVFSITWDSQAINWYIDDTLFHTADITASGLSEFHANYFFIFNVAVGGNWPGSPDGSTQFPQRMIVDYIRVFQPN